LFPTRRLSTKVFLPAPPNCPTLRLSSPTPRLSCDPPTPYPIVFPALLPTRCLSRLHVFMNSRRPTQPRSFTHPRRLLRIQKNAQQREEKSPGKRKSLKACAAQNIGRNFMETTSRHPTNPLSFKKEATRKKKKEVQTYLHFEKRKSLKSFRRGGAVVAT